MPANHVNGPAYRQRIHIGETAHGNIKYNLGFRPLTMRGKRNASREWTFVCAVTTC